MDGSGSDPKKLMLVGAKPPNLATRIWRAVKTTIRGVDMNGQDYFGPGQPLAPFGPDDKKGRALDYPVGFNFRLEPRGQEGVGFGELRGLAENYDILRMLIETRKDQMESLTWNIRPVEDIDSMSVGDKADILARVKATTEFMRFPDAVHPFGTWLRMLVEEQLTIDAPSIYVNDSNFGDTRFEIIDGATIKILLDEDGRAPAPPDPAFQQIIKGMPAWDYTAEELIYLPRNPRPGFIYGCCFSPDTEILTKRGFVSVSEVSYRDLVATRNPDTFAFEWQHPVLLTTRPYEGDLINFKSMGVDVLVTPEHRMIVQDPKTGVERLMPAEEFTRNPGLRVPLTTDSWVGTEIGVMVFGEHDQVYERNAQVIKLRANGLTYAEIGAEMDVGQMTAWDIVNKRYAYDGKGGPRSNDVRLSGKDFCAFMGMYLSEGWVHKTCFNISQRTYSKAFGKFQTALNRMFGFVPHDGTDFILQRKALTEYLKQFGHSHDKFVPDEIMNATMEEINTFLEYLFDGDACQYKNGRAIYYTTSKRMSEQVQELLQKVGRSSTLGYMEGRVWNIRGSSGVSRPQYNVLVNKRKHVSTHARRVPYSGNVHCLSVPNKSVLTRRNGKLVWTSQSPVQQIILTVNIALRRQISQLDYFTAGNIPDALIAVPKEWTPNQIKEYQSYWDSIHEGNLASRRRAKFVPGEAKMQMTAEVVLKDEFDEWLARICCYALSIPPTAFIKSNNRATATAAKEAAEEEGLAPLMSWAKQVVDRIIQHYLKQPDLEFAWADKEDMDPTIQSAFVDQRLRNGTLTINEAREMFGLEGVGPSGDKLMIYTGVGAVLIDDIINPPAPVVPPPAASGGQTPPAGAGEAPAGGSGPAQSQQAPAGSETPAKPDRNAPDVDASEERNQLEQKSMLTSIRKYDPDQPRAANGEFGEGSGEYKPRSAPEGGDSKAGASIRRGSARYWEAKMAEAPDEATRATYIANALKAHDAADEQTKFDIEHGNYEPKVAGAPTSKQVAALCSYTGEEAVLKDGTMPNSRYVDMNRVAIEDAGLDAGSNAKAEGMSDERADELREWGCDSRPMTPKEESNARSSVKQLNSFITKSKLDTDTTLYRGTPFVPSDIENQVGKSFTAPTFNYSTSDKSYAEHFANGEAFENSKTVGWLMEISAAKGSSALSVNAVRGDDHPTAFEHAYLFPTGSKFTIDSVDSVNKVLRLSYGKK